MKTYADKCLKIDSYFPKYEDIVNKVDTRSLDTDSQISQNNVLLNNSTIKKSNRVFVPKEKREDDGQFSDSINFEIILGENKVISHTIHLTASQDSPIEDNSKSTHIKAKTKNGKTLIIPFDVDAEAKKINDRVKSTQDLTWEIRCFIIEKIQYAIFSGNLFS